MNIGDIVRFTDKAFNQYYRGVSLMIDGKLRENLRSMVGRIYLILHRTYSSDAGCWEYHGIELVDEHTIPEIPFPWHYDYSKGEGFLWNDYHTLDKFQVLRTVKLAVVVTTPTGETS